MAQVILPYGYPLLSGQTATTVIYQGTVERSYTNVVDPRTNSQLFARELLSDISKIRGSAGAWVKSAWKHQFGSKWSSVIYQMVKGDVDGYWTDSSDAWLALSELNRQNWRDAAPFQATYNDPGELWFRLLYLVFSWVDDHGLNIFYQPEVAEGTLAESLAWWTAELTDFGWQVRSAFFIDINDRDSGWVFSGAWSDVSDSNASVGTLRETSEPGAYAEIQLEASRFGYGYRQDVDGANVEVKLDGVQIGFANTNGALGHKKLWFDVYREVKTYTYRLIHAGTALEKMRLDFARVYYGYRKIDIDRMIGAWEVFESGGISGNERWHSTGSGERAVEFNFVGSYLWTGFYIDSIYGQMRVIVDGIEHQIIDLYYPSKTVLNNVLIGRFRFGLHRCRLEAVSAAHINIGIFHVLKSKSGMLP